MIEHPQKRCLCEVSFKHPGILRIVCPYCFFEDVGENGLSLALDFLVALVEPLRGPLLVL